MLDSQEHSGKALASGVASPMTCSSCTCFTCWAAKSIEELNSQIEKAKLYDSGTGIITGDPEEPLYGRCRVFVFLLFSFSI